MNNMKIVERTKLHTLQKPKSIWFQLLRDGKIDFQYLSPQGDSQMTQNIFNLVLREQKPTSDHWMGIQNIGLQNGRFQFLSLLKDYYLGDGARVHVLRGFEQDY